MLVTGNVKELDKREVNILKAIVGIVQKQLGYTKKPIVILNTNGFYNNLIGFFEDIIKENFANTASRELYFIANSPEEAVEFIKNYIPAEAESKFIIR